MGGGGKGIGGGAFVGESVVGVRRWIIEFAIRPPRARAGWLPCFCGGAEGDNNPRKETVTRNYVELHLTCGDNMYRMDMMYMTYAKEVKQ